MRSLPFQALSYLASIPLWLGTVATAADIEGDWAGWAYLDDGGDLPLQLSFDRGADGALVGTVSVPVQQAYGLELERVALDDDALRFVRITSNGDRLEFIATIDGGSMTGETTLNGEPFWSYQMRRSDMPFSPALQQDAINFEGVYRASSGRSIVVSSWFWGELLYQDSKTGRRSTLFASGPNEFFAGPLLYTPSPADLRVQFLRSADGQAAEIVVREQGRSPVRAARQEIVTEPISLVSDGVTLAGEVRSPAGAGPFPGVVVIGGSGWAAREGLRANADLFVAMGYSAIIFDKRGHGDSGGEQDVAYAQIARDLLCAHAALGALPHVSADRIGLFGVSRGGWHAPLAASMSDDVAFAVVFVAPAISPEAQERTRRRNALLRQGVDEESIALADQYLDLLFNFGATGEGWEPYLAMREEITERGWLDVLGGEGSPDEALWRWGRLNMRYDPVPAIRNIRCPILVVLGGADDNVTPEENAPLWRAALRDAPTDSFLVHVVPNANHGLFLAPEDGSSPPIHLQGGKAPGVWDLVQGWLSEQ